MLDTVNPAMGMMLYSSMHSFDKVYRNGYVLAASLLTLHDLQLITLKEAILILSNLNGSTYSH